MTGGRHDSEVRCQLAGNHQNLDRAPLNWHCASSSAIIRRALLTPLHPAALARGEPTPRSARLTEERVGEEVGVGCDPSRPENLHLPLLGLALI